MPDHDEKWSRLEAARAAYGRRTSAAYDEVLTEVTARVSTTRSIGKSDIGALLMWKRLRADTPGARSWCPAPITAWS
ncbi:hypothetical protein [Lentzea aerocolonigenes]|uniref:hypothetical protein n=1 Tax=Lentzea aerocolonigenes TaxID=68170 RepID=UPI0012E154B3|nr:hypothetical protein [Lentzea aerocolonigenes]